MNSVPDTPLPPGYTCHRCGDNGHRVQPCPTVSDPNFHSLPPGYTCYRCGEKGHWIQACPTNNSFTVDDCSKFRRTTTDENHRPSPYSSAQLAEASSFMSEATRVGQKQRLPLVQGTKKPATAPAFRHSAKPRAVGAAVPQPSKANHYTGDNLPPHKRRQQQAARSKQSSVDEGIAGPPSNVSSDTATVRTTNVASSNIYEVLDVEEPTLEDTTAAVMPLSAPAAVETPNAVETVSAPHQVLRSSTAREPQLQPSDLSKRPVQPAEGEVEHREVAYATALPLARPVHQSMSIEALKALNGTSEPVQPIPRHDSVNDDQLNDALTKTEREMQCTKCKRWTRLPQSLSVNGSEWLCVPCHAIGYDICDAQRVVSGRESTSLYTDVAPLCASCGLSGHRAVNCTSSTPYHLGPETETVRLSQETRTDATAATRNATTADHVKHIAEIFEQPPAPMLVGKQLASADPCVLSDDDVKRSHGVGEMSSLTPGSSGPLPASSNRKAALQKAVDVLSAQAHHRRGSLNQLNRALSRECSPAGRQTDAPRSNQPEANLLHLSDDLSWFSPQKHAATTLGGRRPSNLRGTALPFFASSHKSSSARQSAVQRSTEPRLTSSPSFEPALYQFETTGRAAPTPNAQIITSPATYGIETASGSHVGVSARSVSNKAQPMTGPINVLDVSAKESFPALPLAKEHGAEKFKPPPGFDAAQPDRLQKFDALLVITSRTDAACGLKSGHESGVKPQPTDAHDEEDLYSTSSPASPQKADAKHGHEGRSSTDAQGAPQEDPLPTDNARGAHHGTANDTSRTSKNHQSEGLSCASGENVRSNAPSGMMRPVIATGPKSVNGTREAPQEVNGQTPTSNPKKIAKKQRQLARNDLTKAWWDRETIRKRVQSTWSLEGMQALGVATLAYNLKRDHLQQLMGNNELNPDDSVMFQELLSDDLRTPKTKLPPVPVEQSNGTGSPESEKSHTSQSRVEEKQQRADLLHKANVALELYDKVISYFKQPPPQGRQGRKDMAAAGRARIFRAKNYYKKTREAFEASFPDDPVLGADLPEEDALETVCIDVDRCTCGRIH